MAQNYCPNCGAELKFSEAEICPTCGVRIKAPPAPKEEKSPGLAAVLSFLFAGSGQVYNGQLGKGILLLLGEFIGAFIFFIPGLIVWIYAIYDAYTTAKKMNTGEIPFLPVKTTDVIIYIIIYVVIIIIIIALVFAAILDRKSVV